MAKDKTTLRLRILMGEDDYYQNSHLYETIVHAAKDEGMAGATVTKGLMGFGANSVIHKSKAFISANLPIVIEIVDEEEKIMNFMDKVGDFFEEAKAGGLITYQEVNVNLYRTFQKF